MNENAIRDRMQKTVEATKKDLARIRTGVASPSMLEDIRVDYYGTPTSITHVSSVTVPEPRTLNIQPFEKQMLAVIEKAIQISDLGLPTQNDGKVIRLSLPVLTTERRQEIAKKVRSVGEEGKIGIRNIRKDENNNLKKLSETESEDKIKSYRGRIQELTDKYINILTQIIEEKEKDIMNV
jgi:ribosome recycling factor